MTARLRMCILLLATAAMAAAGDDTLGLEEVVARNVAARGGAEAWAEISAIKITGTYTSFSSPNPFTIQRKRPKFFRFDHFLGPNESLTAFDGEKAWWVYPFYFRENAIPGPIFEKQDRMTLRDIHIEPTLVKAEEKGFKLAYLGLREFEGETYHVVQVTLPWEDVEKLYLDRETFLEFRREGVGYEYGRSSPMDVFYDDYRKVSGVLIPFLEEYEFHTRARTLRVDRVEINPVIADEVFAMPAKP